MVERDAIFALVDSRGRLAIRVTPNARSERLAIEADTIGASTLKLWVTVPPEDGRANKAVAVLLARSLGLPRSGVRLERGESSRTKIFHIVR